MIEVQRVPPLSLDREDYQIETVFVGKWHRYTGWILLHRDSYGRIETVAKGWTRDYEPACREAFEAMKIHQADLEAARGV